jgi:putative flippase GtrA
VSSRGRGRTHDTMPDAQSPSTAVRLLRHQASSAITTAVDFGVMIACKELLGVSPAVATVFGASSGAVTNFSLGRFWTFEATHSHPRGQAVRYALVSAASLAWNAFGEWLFTDKLGLQYVVARAIVAIAVSLLWNYPLQRFFVFSEPRLPSSTP